MYVHICLICSSQTPCYVDVDYILLYKRTLWKTSPGSHKEWRPGLWVELARDSSDPPVKGKVAHKEWPWTSIQGSSSTLTFVLSWHFAVTTGRKRNVYLTPKSRWVRRTEGEDNHHKAAPKGPGTSNANHLQLRGELQDKKKRIDLKYVMKLSDPQISIWAARHLPFPTSAKSGVLFFWRW